MRPVWDAFWRLNRSRAMGWSAGPIPLTEIEAYVKLFRVRNVGRFVDAIDALDRAYLEHAAGKKKSDQQAKAPRNTGRKHGTRRA